MEGRTCSDAAPAQVITSADKSVRVQEQSAGGAAGPIDFDGYAQQIAPGLMRLEVTIPDIRCSGCISRIEDSLIGHHGVVSARVNVSTKRATVQWRQAETNANELVSFLQGKGHDVLPTDSNRDDEVENLYGRQLLFALALAGFAAGNIMLLSVAVWSGASGATRELFHWLSAVIAIPVILIAGRPFYRSAFKALKAGHLNMDVPISLAVLLAGGMSLFETMTHGEVTYFDAAVMLLFFLLVGRYLDHLVRNKARSAVASLLSLNPKHADQIAPDGTRSPILVSDLQTDMKIAIATGMRIPVDGVISKGHTELDCTHVTGEATPVLANPGTSVLAGTLNLIAPIQIRVTRPASSSFIADMVALMETAEQSKAHYVKLADRAAKLYAPVVHILAALTFLGWMWWSGDWHAAIFAAIAVLIITCPCALGLAVPVVQVVASGGLFQNGIMMKDGAALEKLAKIDTVVFDKTGTLTLGRQTLTPEQMISDADLAMAAGLARDSRHPASRALMRAAQKRGVVPLVVDDIKEHIGCGLAGRLDGHIVRLGAKKWLDAQLPDKEISQLVSGDISKNTPKYADNTLSHIWLGFDAKAPVCFQLLDAIRPDAASVVQDLQAQGITVLIASGDKISAVAATASEVGISQYHGELTPADKLAMIEALTARGAKVLMVGDGLNDAPALAAGYVSMTPADANDVGRASASFVFLGDSLKAVPIALATAKSSGLLVTQNFTLAILYNIVAVPVAMLGYASPLLAAIAMSSSSILVTLNALRLRLIKPGFDSDYASK